ncbi:MAG: signal transduction histidine kinase/FixJ family two-component response regulator [Candidatus Latescibacterota bacterium]|jgi:signal transduction histidine kinase/FixJ family two-component response regulator
MVLMNVLVADDDPMVLETLRKYIVFRGDTAHAVSDGYLAMADLKTKSFDLVLTDIQMPGATGFDVLQAVKATQPDVPVIIITGYGDMDLAIKAVNEGAFAFLPKPILFSELNTKIEEAFSFLVEKRSIREEIVSLQESAVDQQLRLEQAQALSVSILNNIPFPVCVIDSESCIWMANPAFLAHFSAGERVDGRRLQDAVSKLDFGPLSPKDVFEIFRDSEHELGMRFSLEEVAGQIRYFLATGFAVDAAELGKVKDPQALVCLFMQEITARVLRDEEASERQWHLREVSNFRELTNPLVSVADFPEQVVAHLADAVGHFNDALIELEYLGQFYTAGNAVAPQEAYLVRNLKIGDRHIGRITLFSDQSHRVSAQQMLMDDLVDILIRRVESHELQMGIVQSERLQSLGEMSAGVAHELNQPLAGIRTFAEGVVYGLKNDWVLDKAELKETLLDIVGQVDRATEIIDYMRIFSRRQNEDHHEHFSVSDVVQNVLKLMRAQFKAQNMSLFIDIPNDLPACYGRPRQIEQVLLNLLTNARHALDAQMKRDGQDRLAHWSPKVDLGAQQVGQKIQIFVRDTGGGIPEGVVARIFEPFFTSKEVGKGTGLGLSISRTIAQSLDGDLWVDNHPGEGATFYLSFVIHLGEGQSEQTDQ